MKREGEREKRGEGGEERGRKESWGKDREGDGWKIERGREGKEVCGQEKER